MREATYPKEGYIFRHKENKDDFARIMWLADGGSIDEYDQVPIEVYEQYKSEQEKLDYTEEYYEEEDGLDEEN